MIKPIRKRPVVWFSILAFVITYVVGIPAMIALSPVEQALGLREEFLSLSIMRGGPTIAGLIVLAAVAGTRGFGVWLKQLFRINVHIAYYAFIYVSALAIYAASILWTLGPEAAGEASHIADAKGAGALALSYLNELAYITVTNGEETGWRFVMTGLLLAHMRLFPATLIVGLVWAFWHFPALALQGQLDYFWPFIPIALSLAVIYGWLYKATDSLLLPILAHGATNATTYAFEKDFADLNAQLETLGPIGDWNYSAVAGAVAVVILLFNRKLFFAAVKTRTGENWAAAPTRS